MTRLLKIKKATDEFLIDARLQGRLVYVPGGRLVNNYLIHTLRRQRSIYGPLQLIKTGELYFKTQNSSF